MVRTKQKLLAQSLKETVSFYNDLSTFEGGGGLSAGGDGVRDRLLNLYSILEDFSFAKYYDFYGSNPAALRHCLDATVNCSKFSGKWMNLFITFLFPISELVDVLKDAF